MDRGQCFVMSAQARAAKERHQEELQQLHALRAAAIDTREKRCLTPSAPEQAEQSSSSRPATQMPRGRCGL
uniref:MSP domain-containing protein n=1 Tax=Caenorhabditis tropicalis TaxID=1561998 RepID=A0A1I7UPI6_9PELO